MAGVECDGATYHRSKVARDRDKTRQMVLENLGWNILRVWSPDWWYDAKSAMEKLHQNLSQLLENERSVQQPDALDARKANPSIEVNADQSLTEISVAQTSDIESETSGDRATLADVSGNQDRFFDPSYDDQLSKMALEMLQRESPIRDDVLAREIARAHGFARTGANIRTRIFNLLHDVISTQESTGRFLWASETPLPVVKFRPPVADDSRRSVDEIAIAELIGLIQEKKDLLEEIDPAVAIARNMGLARLSQSARERIEEAIRLFPHLCPADKP